VPVEGVASYFTIEASGDRNRHAAWTYRHPFPWIRKIRDHVAFWNGVEVRPSAGPGEAARGARVALG
jgi:uncharacterized protein (DUF427 family)